MDKGKLAAKALLNPLSGTRALDERANSLFVLRQSRVFVLNFYDGDLAPAGVAFGEIASAFS